MVANRILEQVLMYSAEKPAIFLDCASETWFPVIIIVSGIHHVMSNEINDTKSVEASLGHIEWPIFTMKQVTFN